MSKWIGETAEELSRIFGEARARQFVLLLDEADAELGHRTGAHDAHDRFVNLETSFLLEHLESFEGVAILASNLGRDMDQASVRRVRLIVEFSLSDGRDGRPTRKAPPARRTARGRRG